MKTKTLKISLSIIGITIVSFVLINIFSTSIKRYLSITEKVQANILIVEGWLPDFALEMAYKEFTDHSYDYVLTSGIGLPEYFILTDNGHLIFYPDLEDEIDTTRRKHIIEVAAFSQLEGKHRAHFNIHVNDTLLEGFYADKKKKNYEAKWEGDISDIDSIMIQFDNDSVGNFGDRNLWLKEIIIDQKIHLKYWDLSIYDKFKLNGNNRFTNYSNSYAGMAKNKLLAMGLDSSKIIALPAKKVTLFRTLKSALVVSNWMEESDYEIKGVNIVSMGVHSRRTWTTYKELIRLPTDVGIISVSKMNGRHPNQPDTTRMYHEIIGNFFYWFILLVY